MSYTLDQICEAVKASLSPELKNPPYEGMPGMAGYCYPASEAIFHLQNLVGERDKHILKARRMNHEGRSHWFLVDRNEQNPIDLTASQFVTEPDYTRSKGATFRTVLPSKRAQVVITRAMSILERSASKQEEYECYNCHDQGCYQCMSNSELFS